MDLRFAICDLRLSPQRRADSTCAVTRVTVEGPALTAGSIRKSQIANRLPTAYCLLPTPFAIRQSAFGTRQSRAFTLVEVMISIVIALLLVLGISQIFSIAQRTTGAGTQVLASIEINRALQSTLNDDFRGLVNGDDSPGLVIVSQAVPAFRHRPDQQQDRDGQPNTINDTTGNGSLKAMNWSDVNYRMHRVDRICFFTRGSFHRQTADAPSYVSGTTSNEAFVWLGHLALPNNKALQNWLPNQPSVGGWLNPGIQAVSGENNDNNYFATDWVLGRQVMLLSPVQENETEFLSNNNKVNPLALVQALGGPAARSTDGIPLLASRYDLAQTSIDLFRQYINGAQARQASWWQQLSGMLPPGNTPNSDIRYDGNPFPQKPRGMFAGNPQQAAAWMSAATAQTTPVFIRGCTQFIVEFAGDFVTQNPDGTIPKNGNQPDGQIDYNVDPLTGARSIRWYGFPRNAADELRAGQPYIGVVNGYQYGVCPLRDSYGGPAAVERWLPAGPGNNYANWQSSYNANAPYSLPYVVAWGVDPNTAGFPKPKMIRITIAVDDPAGHLNTEQTYEYVFNLP